MLAIWAMRGTSISGFSGGSCRRYSVGLADVDRLVADALQVRVDFHGRRDEAQVGRGGLMQRDHLEAPLIHFDLQLVDFFFLPVDVLHQVALAVRQGFDRDVDHRLRQAPHVRMRSLSC